MMASTNHAAATLRSDYLSAWAVGITNLIHVLDVERVVLTGGMMADAHSFLPELRSLVSGQLWDLSTGPAIEVAHDVWNSVTLGLSSLAEAHLGGGHR